MRAPPPRTSPPATPLDGRPLRAAATPFEAETRVPGLTPPPAMLGEDDVATLRGGASPAMLGPPPGHAAPTMLEPPAFGDGGRPGPSAGEAAAPPAIPRRPSPSEPPTVRDPPRRIPGSEPPPAQSSPSYPRYENPAPGNYPRLERAAAGGQPMPGYAPTLYAAQGATPALRAIDLSAGAPPVIAAPPPVRRSRRILLAVAAGAILVALGYLLLLAEHVGDGGSSGAPGTPRAAPAASASGKTALAAAGSAATASAPEIARPARVEHPRATITAPGAGTVVAAELDARREVARDEKLFVLRQAFDGTARSDRLLLRAPFAATATPRVRKGDGVKAGAVLAELLDESTWTADVEVRGPITVRSACRIRLMQGEARCQIASVDDGVGPRRAVIRFAASDAPWFDGRPPEIVVGP
jgi:hypothetical protein